MSGFDELRARGCDDPSCACHDISIEQVQNKIRADVQRVGWSAIATADVDGTPYLYTIGLEERYEHPELTVAGLPPQRAHSIVAAVCDLIAAGRRLQAGELLDGVLSGCPLLVQSRDVGADGLLWAQAAGHYQDAWFRILQLLWPDSHGRFPTDPDCGLPAGAWQTLTPTPGS
jgi:hypothetical protein